MNTTLPPPACPYLLEVREVHRYYRQRRHSLLALPRNTHALKGISFCLKSGQSLGIVGESGSGKTTLARLIMALDAPDSGSIWFKGHNLHTLLATALRRM